MFRKFPIGLQLPINYFFLYLAIFFQFFRSTPFAAAFFDNISRICTPLSSSEREEIVGFVFRLNKQINIRIYRKEKTEHWLLKWYLNFSKVHHATLNDTAQSLRTSRLIFSDKKIRVGEQSKLVRMIELIKCFPLHTKTAKPAISSVFVTD